MSVHSAREARIIAAHPGKKFGSCSDVVGLNSPQWEQRCPGFSWSLLAAPHPPHRGEGRGKPQQHGPGMPGRQYSKAADRNRDIKLSTSYQEFSCPNTIQLKASTSWNQPQQSPVLAPTVSNRCFLPSPCCRGAGPKVKRDKPPRQSSPSSLFHLRKLYCHF